MNFKKILASVAAAALAVSSMAVCNFAAEETEKVVLSEATSITLWGEQAVEVGAGKPFAADDLTKYKSITVVAKTDKDDDSNWKSSQFIKVYAKAYGPGYEYAEGDNNKSKNGDGIVKGIEGTAAADTEYTVTFSIEEILADLEAKLNEGDKAIDHISAITFQNMYQVEGSQITITKIALTDPVSSGDFDDDSDDETEEVTIMDTPTELKDDWTVSVQIDLSNYTFKAGDKITITYENSDGGQLQLKYNGNGWPTLPGVADDTNADSSWGGYNLTGAEGTLVYILTEEDVENISANGNILIIGGQKVTVSKVTLTPASSTDEGGDDDENEEVTIMDTPTELKDDWSVSVQIDLSNYTFKAGDKITITYEKSDGGQLQPKYNDNGWPTLPGVTDDANADSSWGGYNLTGAEGTLVYTLTEEDVENISANGNILIIGGQKVTVSKVTLTSASSTDEGDDDDDDGDNTSGIPATPSGGNSSSENTTASEATAAPEETAASENVSDTAASEDTEASEAAPEDTTVTSVVVEPGPVETTGEEATTGDSDDGNQPTGIVLAVIPAAAAAAGVTAAASRKRK